MRKRIITSLLICALLLTVCMPVFAGSVAEISISANRESGKFYVNQEMGGKIKVELENVIVAKINIDNAYDADVCSGIIYINYNTDEVQCLGYNSVTGGTWEVNDKTNGSLRMAFSKTDAIDDGTVFAAAFEFVNGVTETTFSLSIGELLTGDVVDGDVPVEYMLTQERVTYKDGTQPPVDDLLMGDANLDEKVNTADAVTVLKHSAGMITLEGKAFTQADVNYNGGVNTADATLILKFAAGIITEL